MSGPDPIDLEVGMNLRQLRLARNHSQSALADALGLTFQQIQKYERGTNRMSASMLVKAARFLGVRAVDLLPPDDSAGPAADFIQRFVEVRGAADIVNAYCAVENPALRRAVLQFVRVMARTGAPSSDEPETE
jgi:transcriptional regulator with XRE-family HTH domain